MPPIPAILAALVFILWMITGAVVAATANQSIPLGIILGGAIGIIAVQSMRSKWRPRRTTPDRTPPQRTP